MKGRKFPEELVNVMVEYYKNGISPYKMIEKDERLSQIRPSVIYGILQRLGLTPDNRKLPNDIKMKRRKYTVWDNAFSEIDSEEKAYWLGFMYADGYVTTSESKVGLSLAIVDKNHLEKFKKFLITDAPINEYRTTGYKTGSPYCRLQVTSEVMKNNLIKHGCCESKTDKLIFPNFIPEHLIHHFIRGYFDGDGSLATGSLKNNIQTYSIKICGTYEILQGILSAFNIDSKLFQRFPERNVNNYYISIGGRRQVGAILDSLYNNATIYLTRKHEKYLKLKQELNE